MSIDIIIVLVWTIDYRAFSGTIHLREYVGGEGSKIGQICLWIVVKELPMEGGKGRNSEKLLES